MKSECTRQVVVPFRLADFRRELSFYVCWYNEIRPHQGLEGRIPQEVYDGADPPASHTNQPNSKLPPLKLQVSHFERRRHLPVVELRKAA